MKLHVTLILLLLFLLPVAALGQTGEPETIKAINITNLADGDYLLTKKGDAVSLVPMLLITPGTTPVKPTEGLTKISQDKATATGDLSTAQSIVVSLSVVVLRHEQDAFSDLAKVQEAYASARAAVLKTQDQKRTWNNWESALNNELTRLLQNPGDAGGIDTPDEYVKAVAQIRDGVGNYVKDSGSGQAINIFKIIELIQLVMDAIGGEGIDFGKLLKLILEIITGFGNSASMEGGAQ